MQAPFSRFPPWSDVFRGAAHESRLLAPGPHGCAGGAPESCLYTEAGLIQQASAPAADKLRKGDQARSPAIAQKTRVWPLTRGAATRTHKTPTNRSSNDDSFPHRRRAPFRKSR